MSKEESLSAGYLYWDIKWLGVLGVQLWLEPNSDGQRMDLDVFNTILSICVDKKIFPLVMRISGNFFQSE